MASASKYWILLLFVFFILSCGSNKPQPKEISPMKKAYILVRTEGNYEDITQFRDILNSDFIANDIAPEIVTSELGSSWNTNQIFSTAYSDNYDYIILIDQVAKFTIDQRTKVGGKYQIRSYDIKSTNPDWLDLGQLTCNMTVKPSIQKFAGQVVGKIVPNYKPSLTFLDNEESAIVNTSFVPSDKLKTPSELDNEIEKLKQQLQIEKEKTEKALEEKNRLERKYQEQLEIEKQKVDLAIANFEAFKKTNADAEAEQLRKESETKRQKELAETYANKREEILRREAEELKNNPSEIVSDSKDTSRKEALKQRQEAKKRLIEERALKRKKAQETAAKRIEDRKKLVEAKREDQKRIRAELERKRQEQKRLARTKSQERPETVSQARFDQKIIDKQKILFQEKIEKERIKEKRRLAKLENEQEKKKKRELEKAQRLEEQLSILENQEEQQLTLDKVTEEEENPTKSKALQKEKPEGIIVSDKSNEVQETSNQKLSKDQKRLAKDKKEQEEYERKQQIRDQKRLAKKKSEVKNSMRNPKKLKPKSNKVLIIIQGNQEDEETLKKLQDKLVIELSVKKISSTSFILNNEEDLNQQEIINQNKTTNKLIVIINQLDSVEDGIFNYKISTFDHMNSTWDNYDSELYNSEKRNSIKSIVKKIITKLQ